MSRRILRTAIFAAVFLVLIGAAFATLRMRSERNDAKARATRLQAGVALLRSQLKGTHITVDVLNQQIDSRDQTIEGLQGQVGWDKSHLLDCWTAIVRIVPRDSLPPTVRTSVWAARSGESLSHYIYNCATDAVP